jgi:hypothetical protein
MRTSDRRGHRESVLTLVAEEVQPGARRRVGVDGGLERTKSVEIPRAVGRVAPHREEMGVPERLTLPDRDGVDILPGDQPTARNDQDLGEGRRDRDRGHAEGVDRIVEEPGVEVTARSTAAPPTRPPPPATVTVSPACRPPCTASATCAVAAGWTTAAAARGRQPPAAGRGAWPARQRIARRRSRDHRGRGCCTRAVAGRESGGTGAGGNHRAGDIAPDHERARHRRRKGTGTHERVHPIDRDRLHPDQDILRTSLGHRQLAVANAFRSAELIDRRCPHMIRQLVQGAVTRAGDVRPGRTAGGRIDRAPRLTFADMPSSCPAAS